MHVYLSVSHIVAEEYWPTPLYNNAPVLTEVCRHVFMHSFLKVPHQYLNQVEVWTLTELLQAELLILFFDMLSVVDLLLCLGSLSCCMTQIRPSFSCQTGPLNFLVN